MASHPTPLRACSHHAYKSWTTWWRDDFKKKRCKRFGRTDRITKKIAQASFQRWLSEWRLKHHVRSPGDPAIYTVAQLVEDYLRHADRIYRKRGEVTSHVDQVKCAMEALAEQYGSMPADAIGAPEVARLRDGMVKARAGGRGALARGTVNARLRIIKQSYRWARVYGRVSREAAYDVSIVPSLRAGESDAKETAGVRPVPLDVLDNTLAVATPTIGAMIRLQAVTGMRSGELCGLRVCDIDRQDHVWTYEPISHKTQHHGKRRVIFFGPQAQDILKPFIAKRDKISEYVFLPSETHRERLEATGFAKVIAYQLSRSTFKPGRRFNEDSYCRQVYRTCDQAFDADGKKVKAKDFSHRWNPHRLRHNAATAYRERFGIEAATDVLGHASFNTATIYAEKSDKRMKEFVALAG